MFKTRCSKPAPIALAVAAIFLSGCAAVGSNPVVVCPPVPDYDQAFLGEVAAAVEALPSPSPIDRLLEDYSVMRGQSRVCARAGG